MQDPTWSKSGECMMDIGMDIKMKKGLRDPRSNGRAGGQQERKCTEDHIQQIFIILFLNHVLFIFLSTGFALIRE